MSKSVVFTFGRFNPPTTGHELLANRLRAVAKKERIREIRLYPSQSQDSKKNPLSFRDKVKFLRKAFSGIKVVADTSIKTIFQACEKLSDEGYKNVVLVVGGDRVSEFQTRINKYIGPDGYQFDSFKVVEAGKRDPDADDVTGMSASKLRGLAADGDYEAFKDGAPSGLAERDKKAMYNAVRKGMGIREMKEENYEELLPEQFALAGRPVFDDEEDDDQFTSTTPGTRYVSPFDPERPVQRKQRGVDDVLPSQRPGVQPQQMPPIGRQGLVSPDQLQFPVQDPRQQPAQQPLQAGAPGGLGKLLAALKQKQLSKQGQQAPQQQQMPQMPQMPQMQQMMQMMAGQQQAPQQQQDQFATLKKPSDPLPQFAGGDVQQMSQVNRQPDAGQGLPEYGQGSGKKYNRQEILDKLAHGGVYQQPDNQKFTPFGATFKIFANSPQERDSIVAYSQRFSRPGDYHQVSYGGIEPRGGVQKFVVVIMVNNDAHFQEFNQYLQSMRIDFEELTLIPGQLETPEQKQAREQARNAPQQQQGMMPGMGM